LYDSDTGERSSWPKAYLVYAVYDWLKICLTVFALLLYLAGTWRKGFWMSAAEAAPDRARATTVGRIMTASGRGVANRALVVLLDSNPVFIRAHGQRSCYYHASVEPRKLRELSFERTGAAPVVRATRSRDSLRVPQVAGAPRAASML
jgi:hypothetical protein